MEFKFREVDDRPPSYLPPSSSISYFSEQALRANYAIPPNFMQHPRDFYAMQREIEKERIRQEIIAEENMRRRLLEEEVRRELMMEREMAMRKEGKMAFEERLTMRFDSGFPFMHQFDNRCHEDRLAFPGNRSLGLGTNVSPPIFPQLTDAMTDETKTALEVNKKDKLIILAKPEPNLCGSKRKAATLPAGDGELPILASLKKNKPEEWSCALCQVSATSERGLNEHLQGKKHQAKERALRAQKMLHKNSNASLPKKSGKQIKLAETRVIAGSELERKVEEESLKLNKTKKMEDREDLKNKNDLPKRENGNAKNQKKKNGVPTAGKVEKTPEARKKKFKFWCEICYVGAFSEVVMENHKKGKKHMLRIQKLQIDETISNKTTRTTTRTTMVASPEPTEKTSAVDVATSPEPTEKTSAVDVATSPEPTKKASKMYAVTSSKPTEEASNVNVVASPKPTEKASDVNPAASPEPAEKASDVAAAASPSPAEKASVVATAASLDPTEKASDIAAAASPEPADNASDSDAGVSPESTENAVTKDANGETTEAVTGEFNC